MNIDPMMMSSEPLTVAARRVAGMTASTERVVPVEIAQRIRDEAVKAAVAPLRTAFRLAETSLNDWAEFNDELTDLLGDHLDEVDGDGAHHSVLIDCVREALTRSHEAGAASARNDQPLGGRP